MGSDVEFPDDFPEEVDGVEQIHSEKDEDWWKHGKTYSANALYEADDGTRFDVYRDRDDDEFVLKMWTEDRELVGEESFETAAESLEGLKEVIAASNEGDI